MKEQYIQMRKTGQYSLEWFYRYFIEHPSRKIDMNFPTFNQFFNTFFAFSSELIFEKIDKEYSLTVITFNDKIIDVY